MTLGLLGLGNETTTYYLSRLNTLFAAGRSSDHTCPLLLRNVDFSRFNPHLPHGFETLIPALSEELQALQAIGATTIILPNITLHETFDRLVTAFPVCHAVDQLLGALVNKNITEVILYGSRHTMGGSYLSQRLAKVGITVHQPRAASEIDRLRQHLYRGDSVGDQLIKLAKEDLRQSHVVVACTELSIGLADLDHPQKVDMVETQLRGALRQARLIVA